MDRRAFLLAGLSPAALDLPPVRLAVIGTGNRGAGLLRTALRAPAVQVTAVCDLRDEAARRAADIAATASGQTPRVLSGSENAWRGVLELPDVDAVLIATPWQWHAAMAVESMRAGKYTGVEVPIALTCEECWQLLEVHEQTRTPCMMMENWSFRRDNLAVLNMIRGGLFGRMVHCHCAHSHDCVDHWFFDREGRMRWGGEFLARRNADQYPTHSLGPVLSWLDINCGDAFDTISSHATASLGINEYFRRRFGPDHPYARQQWKQGDIVTSVVRTKMGKTIVINYDMQLPRPYDNRWMAQGTLGLYDEARSAVYIAGRSPRYHEWEPFAPYQEEYEHPWWKAMRQPDTGGDPLAAGHGGTDDLEVRLFLQAARGKTPLPLDLIDSLTMSAVIAGSEESIAKAGAPVPFPDFTRGRWRERKPYFGLVQ